MWSASLLGRRKRLACGRKWRANRFRRPKAIARHSAPTSTRKQAPAFTATRRDRQVAADRYDNCWRGADKWHLLPFFSCCSSRQEQETCAAAERQIAGGRRSYLFGWRRKRSAKVSRRRRRREESACLSCERQVLLAAAAAAASVSCINHNYRSCSRAAGAVATKLIADLHTAHCKSAQAAALLPPASWARLPLARRRVQPALRSAECSQRQAALASQLVCESLPRELPPPPAACARPIRRVLISERPEGDRISGRLSAPDSIARRRNKARLGRSISPRPL